MNYINVIEGMIKDRKYVRNDIGMGRVQYARLFTMENELFIIIISNELEGPFVTRVEKIIIVNGEIIVFYDGEYGDILNKEEKNELKHIINNEEWDAIFSDDTGKALEKIGIILTDEGFYAEMHDTIEDYLDEGYEEEVSEEICKHFSLV